VLTGAVYQMVEPADQLGDDLVPVGLVQDLVPGAGIGAGRHVGQARGLIPFGQWGQQCQAAVHRVGLADGDVDRQAGPDRGDLSRIGAPPRAGEHGPGRIGVDPEAAARIGHVGVDDDLITG